MSFLPSRGLDLKSSSARMLEEYLSTQKKVTEAFGKDVDVDIPGYGTVNGSQSFTMVLAMNYYNELGFQMPFQSMWDGYKFIYDLEKQLASIAVA